MSELLKWLVNNYHFEANEIRMICYFEIMVYSAFIVMLVNASKQLFNDFIKPDRD